MTFIPCMANTAEVYTFRRGKQDYVMVRFFFTPPPIQPVGGVKPMTPEPLLNASIPVSTIILDRADYKAIIKTFTGFLAKQEHSALGPIPGMEDKKDGKDAS